MKFSEMESTLKKFAIFLIVILNMTLINTLLSCTSISSHNSRTFVDLINMIPADSSNGGNFILIDYSKIWQDAGITFLNKDNSKMDREQVFNTLVAINKRISGDTAFQYSSFYSGMDGTVKISPISYDTLGYNLVTDVNSEIIRIHTNGNDTMIGMKGNFTIQATKDALQNQDNWTQWAKDNFSIEQYLEIPLYSWDEHKNNDLKLFYSPPHFDMWGTARPLAATNGSMLIGDTVEIVKNIINATLDESPSMADYPEYLLNTQKLDSLNVYYAFITDTVTTNKYLSLIFPVQSFQTIGFGDGNDKRGEYKVIVMVYETEELAKEDASILKERWGAIQEKVTKGNMNIKVELDGRVLSAKMYTN